MGNKEIFKDVQGYEGIYQISNLGMVKNSHRDKFLINNQKAAGYPVVMLSLNGKPKLHSIHRLIAIHFIPNPDNKPQVNHINGIKTDNRIDNLEWVTHYENAIHAVKNGLTANKGENNGSSKLKMQDIIKIKKLLQQNISGVNISKMFSISTAMVSLIKSGKKWGHL